MRQARILQGDVLDRLPELETESFDGCLCDPPYHYRFMGKAWDGGDVAFRSETWAAVLLVLKPGAFLLAFGGTRTYHRLACAIEDAGFEIRDSVLVPGAAWVYGSGFPKSLDIAKALDKAAGAERRVVGVNRSALRPNRTKRGLLGMGGGGVLGPDNGATSTAPATDAARDWQDYGTALKPAWEPIVVAMKPLVGTFAENALQHGVAGLNIEGCRVGSSKEVPASASSRCAGDMLASKGSERSGTSGFNPNIGRWPANLILVHHPECVLPEDEIHEARLGFEAATRSPTLATRRLETSCHPDCPVADLDRQSGYVGGGNGKPVVKDGFSCGLVFGDGPGAITQTYADTGFASRLFYVAKVSPAERAGSKHPTLKPVDLCAYLAKLILPPPREDAPRRLLVPFAGAGSEIIGALRAGWEEVVGIEKESESIEDAHRRVLGDAPLLTRVEVHPEGEPAAAEE